MEREEVVIGFADLRRLAREVPAWLAAGALAGVVPPLRADVEGELGLAGDDTVDLLRGFARTYGVELAGFDFRGCISPEPAPDPLGGLLFLMAGFGLLVATLLRLLASLAGEPFDARRAGAVLRGQLPVLHDLWPQAPATRTRVLTAGDFVASAAAGRFVTRGQVRFRLARG